MSFSPLIRQLIDAFRVLPGVGQKTAQRMALQLLERDRSGGQRINQGAFREIILATNPTVEGEATAHYIAQILADQELLISRLAHGMPLGGELEMVDGGTLSHALAGRRPIQV